MNYTIQRRIKEIIELLDQIINDLERNIRKFNLERPNAEHRRETYQRVIKFFDSKMAWENIVLEKTNQLKKSIQNEYQVELEELEKKQFILDDWRFKFDDNQFDKIRPYFFDEHFLIELFSRNPQLLLEVEKFIIADFNIAWRPTFTKIAIELITKRECNFEPFNHLISCMQVENWSTNAEEFVPLLFSPERFNKVELDQKIKSNYDRFLKIDALINNGFYINHIYDLEINLELVLSSLISSEKGYQYIPDNFKSNELVYLFAAFNNSQSFKYAIDNIRKNEAIVNFALTIDENKFRTIHIHEEKRTIKIQHARNIYPHASEEIKANTYIAFKTAGEFGAALQFMNDILKNNRAIVEKCIANNGCAIQYVPEPLRSDKELSILALKQNPNAFDHLNVELKYDLEILSYISDSKILNRINIPKKIKTTSDLNKQLLLQQHLLNPEIINYCGVKLQKWFLKYQEEQEIYNNWLKNETAQRHEQMNGLSQISPNESYFISKYAIHNCIDVGCGTGNRTFPTFLAKQIDFKGIDNQTHLIEHRSFKNHIIKKDITSPIFDLEEIDQAVYDIAFYFGGVINGFISNPVRFSGWRNLEKIAKKHAKYVLVDTLSHFNWFKDETKYYGEVIQLNPVFPPQFFYSQKGLKSLFAKHQLDIVEEKEEPVGPFKRTHYLLKYISQ